LVRQTIAVKLPAKSQRRNPIGMAPLALSRNVVCADLRETEKSLENKCCVTVISLLIVAAAAALMARSKFRRRRFSFARDTHCGCAGAGRRPQSGSIVFRARKGERPEVLVKMR
jgi:hypothetical protein